MLLSPSTLGIAAGVFLIAGVLFYRALLPKPIPGIPHKVASGRRLLGDIPDALAYYGKTREMITFLQSRCGELNSPIVQVFVRPFRNPWVVVCDAQEAVDIMSRRTREFDRSEFFGDLFVGPIPHNQVGMKTNDTWRANRKLMADTMSPHFLNSISAPHIYGAVQELLALWREKTRLSAGRPIKIDHDIHKATLDAIWAAAFGSDIGVTSSQKEHLSKLDQISLPGSKDTAPEFPQAPTPAAFNAIIAIAESSEIPMNSPLPRIHHKLALKFSPSLSSAVKAKNALIREKLDAAWEKFSVTGEGSDEINSATDLIVHKEVRMAEKEGRAPEYDSKTVQDELLGFLLAGHETSATSICWGLKFLTDNPEVAKKLRSAMQDALPEARDAGENPSAVQIAKAHIPYLDAVIEEVLRAGCTAAANVRTTTVDTQILGYDIPKGTDVFMPVTGPSYRMAPFDIDKSKRSATSRQAEDKVGVWDLADIERFKPERWIDDHGEFNSRAGPENTFGGGPRGCFGKKLAHVEMRLFFALIVWSFELQRTPAELSTYAAKDVLTHAPQQVYVRLTEAN